MQDIVSDIFFYNTLGVLIIEYYGLTNQFSVFEKYYIHYGIWIVLGAGFTPFPFKFITIASGVFGLNVFLFTIISIIARGLRFFLLAFLLKLFGLVIEQIIDKYFNILATLFFILLDWKYNDNKIFMIRIFNNWLIILFISKHHCHYKCSCC